MKNSYSLYKIEYPSTDLQQCFQMSSNNLCHGLVLKIHRVLEIQIDGSPTVTRNEKFIGLVLKILEL